MQPNSELSDTFKDRFNKWPVSREGCSISPLMCSLLKLRAETGWSNFKGKRDSSFYSATAFFGALQNAELIFIKEDQLFIFNFFFIFAS